MANSKVQTVTEVDFLENGSYRAYMTVTWPDDSTGEVNDEDTHKQDKVFATWGDLPQIVKDFIAVRTP